MLKQNFQITCKTSPRKGGNGQWTNGLPGIQTRKIGQYWVKRVNPDSNRFMQWWGQRTINAQHRGTQRLGDMATPHGMRGGRLFPKDVGETFSGGLFSPQMLNPTVLGARVRGSIRMRSLVNDIVPRNMGRNGLIFDPAIDGFSKSVGAGALGLGV